MKYFYVASAIEKDGKMYSFVHRFTEHDNIASAFLPSNGYFVKWSNLCETKNRAYELANGWDEQFRAKGIFYWD